MTYSGTSVKKEIQMNQNNMKKKSHLHSTFKIYHQTGGYCLPLIKLSKFKYPLKNYLVRV